MNRQMLGRLWAMILGIFAGLVLTMVMMPVHLEGTIYVVDRIAYDKERVPQRGDTVVVTTAVFTESGNGGRLVRQVIGIEGDRIQITEGRLQVNGEDVMDLWGFSEEFPEDMEPVRVKKDHVFVLNERIHQGLDSRSDVVGQTAVEDLWGRVVYMRKEKRHGTEKALG